MLVKECLISLTYKTGKLSYIDITNEKFKKSILSISPYEYCTNNSTFFSTQCIAGDHRHICFGFDQKQRQRAI